MNPKEKELLESRAKEFAYRVDDAYVDWIPGFLERFGTFTIYEEYEIIKHTPKGFWINDHGRKRWISKTSVKKFAYFTREEALVSYKARKKRQIQILEEQLQRAKRLLDNINTMSQR